MSPPFEGCTLNGDKEGFVVVCLEEIFTYEGMEIFRDGSAVEPSFIDSLEEILRRANTGDTSRLRELHRYLVSVTERIKEQIEALEDAV
jgi:hypothetical protein